jgi:hypothetical protein
MTFAPRQTVSEINRHVRQDGYVTLGNTNPPVANSAEVSLAEAPVLKMSSMTKEKPNRRRICTPVAAQQLPCWKSRRPMITVGGQRRH